ncbi:putative WSS1 Protein involved in sister chromatid separation and segregation [Rosellinia necatrix]|uniref:Putative WSS1 Protein involved in sister chromatid separation and segregation n=1 Tax=Rosellinia necatrix TaxID=77044 RepID=A0A1S7ULY0_ROSNE|nr:putative WSS1 Protein involved in sister chromatid separation and segregation [Rosellinia necatrix]
MPEIDPLIQSYLHLARFPRSADALHILKKVASLVKPLMRARGWRVGQLTEFYPSQANLLGLNVNRGQKICLRLRYPGSKSQFLPLEQIADTMLHELSHIVYGPHDAKFQALWDQLRDEHLSLTIKGYTGEGFLSEGHRLGGRTIPMDEARRMARAAAEQRHASSSGSGRRLGGATPRPGEDMRKLIADRAEYRNRSLQGCANDNQTQNEIIAIADTATRDGFETRADEDTANDAAIAQALWEIVQEEERARKGAAYVPPTAPSNANSHNKPAPRERHRSSAAAAAAAAQPSASSRPLRGDGGTGKTWACAVCTLHNPASYLCCDACGTEKTIVLTTQQRQQQRQQQQQQQQAVVDLTGPDERRADKRTQSTPSGPATTKSRDSRQAAPYQSAAPPPRTWTCHVCGRVRESLWWSCDLCGTIKLSSN